MDKDTRQMIEQLCTRAGMLMEDWSAVAITTREISDAELHELLGVLATAARHMIALIDAARVLADQLDQIS